MKNRLKQLRNSVTRLRRDEKGVAAIEFAFIAPVMITMYFGLAEVAEAIAVDRSISHGTNVAGDLATQQAQLASSDIEEALAAALRVMNASDVSKVSIDIRSYSMDSAGTNVEGVVQLNDGASNLPAFDVSELDDKILSEDSGVVVTRVAYTYTPLKLRFFNTDITLQETFLLKPRRSDAVILGENVPQTVTCSATNFSDVSCSGADI